MKAIRLALLAAACSVPLLAAAQWQWVEKDGRKVFSDQPPPADVPRNRILKQPGARAPAAPPAAAEAIAPQAGPAATTKTDANAPRVSGRDRELEAKKKAAEAAEAAKKKLEDEKFAAAKAENCTRARSAKLGFDSGVRIARTNAQGEREFLDDKQRESEVKRLEAIISRDCVK